MPNRIHSNKQPRLLYFRNTTTLDVSRTFCPTLALYTNHSPLLNLLTRLNTHSNTNDLTSTNFIFPPALATITQSPTLHLIGLRLNSFILSPQSNASLIPLQKEKNKNQNKTKPKFLTPLSRRPVTLVVIHSHSLDLFPVLSIRAVHPTHTLTY